MTTIPKENDRTVNNGGACGRLKKRAREAQDRNTLCWNGGVTRQRSLEGRDEFGDKEGISEGSNRKA